MLKNEINGVANLQEERERLLQRIAEIDKVLASNRKMRLFKFSNRALKIGKTYKAKNLLFGTCRFPLDCCLYNDLQNSRYFEVEVEEFSNILSCLKIEGLKIEDVAAMCLDGNSIPLFERINKGKCAPGISDRNSSIRCVEKITIKKELSPEELIFVSHKYIREHCYDFSPIEILHWDILLRDVLNDAYNFFYEDHPSFAEFDVHEFSLSKLNRVQRFIP